VPRPAGAGAGQGRVMAVHAEVHAAHPPEAHRSSRVEAATLGMLLFIASEVMLFGSFFTAYFFVRVVNEAPQWPPEGFELPVFVAGVNTAILLTSSFTMHWALQAIKRGSRAGMQAGLVLTLALGLTFLLTQVREYMRVGFAPYDEAFGTIFYGLTGLHGAHVFVGLTLLTFATIRAFRGHYSPQHHLGVEIPGIYWHFVDVMWIVVYTTIYIL
jgi:cytochrome c oxidase subunit 3